MNKPRARISSYSPRSNERAYFVTRGAIAWLACTFYLEMNEILCVNWAELTDLEQRSNGTIKMQQKLLVARDLSIIGILSMRLGQLHQSVQHQIDPIGLLFSS